ncbi:conserved protein of unknown function [Bradyrhizobium sp. ORS 285]|uniref:DUF6719 family protein n=1 Tax=Bradyrhizobium sp. ORS 285 TaxID=115808 RepID=UPI0002409AB1|nr:DUF6719 family protein [Bradyrhizobium sp. ORS 285]CCD88142.1 conserved hypothetical protein [Bradyrhizobium sp. ORS 285]SMX58877.1 conserved protein of unknown function [Bradyrhizobium sp. ORS 285]
MRFRIPVFPSMAARGLSGLALLLLLAAPSHAQYVGREEDVTDLRLGQRVLVDDGTCPAGQVKEVLGSKMAETGIVRTVQCVPRFGPKKK